MMPRERLIELPETETPVMESEMASKTRTTAKAAIAAKRGNRKSVVRQRTREVSVAPVRRGRAGNGAEAAAKSPVLSALQQLRHGKNTPINPGDEAFGSSINEFFEKNSFVTINQFYAVKRMLGRYSDYLAKIGVNVKRLWSAKYEMDAVANSRPAIEGEDDSFDVVVEVRDVRERAVLIRPIWDGDYKDMNGPPQKEMFLPKSAVLKVVKGKLESGKMGARATLRFSRYWIERKNLMGYANNYANADGTPYKWVNPGPRGDKSKSGHSGRNTRGVGSHARGSAR